MNDSNFLAGLGSLTCVVIPALAYYTYSVYAYSHANKPSGYKQPEI